MTEKITIDDFSKLDLRVGEIKKAEPHPNADKLLVLTVDLGEDKERTIVAGLKGHYEPSDLEGKKAIFISNLEPAELRGVESNGMILAAVSEDKEKITILQPEEDMPAGTKIS
tara:strand:+ start:8448 stop:8786 length:339 start_codon:yes stop_codon:yes gene_type:complete